MMRAVDAIMECLKAEGVDVVFGYPGGANLPTYDAMYESGIRHIPVPHEPGGGHAAGGTPCPPRSHRQALLHDPPPRGDPARGARGLPHRADGPSRPRADRHAD